MGFQDYLTSLADNPYFGAGAGLFGVGVVTQAARKGSVILSSLLKRKYVLTMEVPSSDKSYEWLMTWITTKAARKTQHLSVQTLFQRSDVTGRVRNSTSFLLPGFTLYSTKTVGSRFNEREKIR